MIIHHHTKFSKRRLSGLGDTGWIQSDTRTVLQMDGQTDKVIPMYPPPPGSIYIGGGGEDKNFQHKSFSLFFPFLGSLLLPECMMHYRQPHPGFCISRITHSVTCLWWLGGGGVLACKDLGKVWQFILHLCFLLCGDLLAHNNSTLWARTSPKWISELRQLWPSVPWWAVRKLTSLIGSLAMPGQQSSPIPTWLGQGCPCVQV